MSQAKRTWNEFCQEYFRQLKGLFHTVQGERQPLMKRIVIYSLCLLIGLLCCIGMACNGYAVNVPCFLIPILGLVCAMGADVKRYRGGVSSVPSQEMGKRSPAWVRWLIALFGLAVIAFAIAVLID